MEKSVTLSRREFLRRSTTHLAAFAAAGVVCSCSQPSGPAAEGLPSRVPKRILGRTGLSATILAYGGGSQFARNEDGRWEPQLERAVEMGVNLFDTAPGYQWEASMSCEERFGKILPKYRSQILLSTKIDSRDVTVARKEFERSLKRMRTDYLDILMIHAVSAEDDPAHLQKGVYRLAQELQEQGVVKHIGFSAMQDGKVAKAMIEALDPDVVLLTLNATQYGEMARLALPAAQERNVGVMAMKVMLNLVGKSAAAPELLQYAWTLPDVASAIIGHFGMEPLEENYRLAAEFGRNGSVSTVTAQELETRLRPLAGPHALCWARPDYRDGIPA